MATLNSYEIGDLVWATKDGSTKWPGVVAEPTNELKIAKKGNNYCIFFFGTNNFAWIEPKGLEPYSEPTNSKRKSSAFRDAVSAVQHYKLTGEGGPPTKGQTADNFDQPIESPASVRTNNEPANDEVVPYVGSRHYSKRKSFADSLVEGHDRPENMVSIGKFVNTICGRIFHLQSSKKTEEIMGSLEDGSDSRQFGGAETVNTYHTLVMANVLKKRLQTHYFYSKHCVNLIESNPKRPKRSNEADLVYKYQIRKSVEGVCDTAISLENIVATEKKHYREVLMGDIQHPYFWSSWLQQLEDYRSTLKEQVVDKELKQRIMREREEIKFLGELCSRLNVVTPINKSALTEAFLDTKDILNQVNGIATSKK